MRRAFILAIEKYAQMTEGLAKELPGTHAAATTFRSWLIANHGLQPEHVYFCTEDPALAGRTAGASRDEVAAELLRLQTEGKDKTEELFFFFSGHGFCYTDVDGARLADVLIAADYKNRQLSGNACLKVDEIQKWLKMCLGPQDHYYFIDACRNSVSERDIKVGTLGIGLDLSRLGVPTVYTLYSTAQGATAAVGSGFPGVLMEGLNGRGRAKAWQGAKMAVLFGTLKDYVEQKLAGQPIDERKEGSGKGVILEIDPAPRYSCAISVTNAGPEDTFRATVTTTRGATMGSFTFTGPTHTSDPLPPDEYLLKVEHSLPGFEVRPVDALPADLYDECAIRFEQRAIPIVPVAPAGAAPVGAPAPAPPARARSGPVFRGAAPAPPAPAGAPMPPPPPPPSQATLTVHGPRGARVVVKDLIHGDTEADQSGTFTLNIAPGRYNLSVMDGGVTVYTRDVQIGIGETPVIDLAQFKKSPLRDALLAQVPGSHGDGAAQFSETLGDITDQGLDLWLAIVGASRIVGGQKDGFFDYSKLGQLPLQTFNEQREGRASIYVLAGFDRADTRLRASIGRNHDAELTEVAPNPQFPGLFETVVRDAAPGHHFVSIALGDGVPLTIGTCALPDRVALVTVTHGDRGGIRYQQFILPLAHLEHRQPLGMPPVQERLRAVRRMVQVQRSFAAGEELRGLLSPGDLDEILFLKWMEPLVAVLAAYELIRRGDLRALPIAVGNLAQYYGTIPDVQALARLAGLPWTMPDAPPLVLEGFMALDLMKDRHAELAQQTDFRGPWAAWRRT